MNVNVAGGSPAAGHFGGYPVSMQDVNYAIRWCKSRAAEFSIDPKRVGILGVSSGGHQAMLSAMRPNDAL